MQCLKNYFLPKQPPDLKEIILIIAQMGGFLNRKGDQHPGAKTMWTGLQKMNDFAAAWKTFMSLNLHEESW